MSSESVQLWDKCLSHIRQGLNNNARFENWFAKTRALAFDGRKLTVQLPSHYCFELFEDQFYDLISSALLKTFGRTVQLEYRVPVVADDDDASMVLPRNSAPSVSTPASRVSKVSASDTLHESPARQSSRVPGSDVLRQVNSAGNAEGQPPLNPSLSFENYCISNSNRLPASIAQSIAKNPVNSNFNPFFLYGNVGVCKTHLMQAIGLQVLRNFPNAKVCFIPMKEFQRLYFVASSHGKIPDFVNWFMEMDVLLFDDLQELENKTKTLNNGLFPIFNHLHQNGKQLVFTCDRPPQELKGIADRLIDRFKWGITEQLPRPDFELRRQILSFKASKNGLELDRDVIDTIASGNINSVREIEGIVMGILTRSINLNAPITVDMAREVMRNSVGIPVKKTVNFDMIVEATADYYNLNPDVIFSKSKVRDVSDARMIIMYLSHKIVGLSSVAIGHKLRRKHSTVLHGIRAIADRITVAPELSEAVAAIEKNL